MYRKLASLINVKPGETKLVGQLFLIQFFLGVATAFLFTSSLTLFLSTFEVKVFPLVYMLAAVVLLICNYLYSRFEEKLTAVKRLQVIAAFATVSVLGYWLIQALFSFVWSPLLLAVWSIILYMLIGYGFWGMTAILFNVREGRRLFSIVGAGDIPAKMLGYLSVTILVPFIGVVNLLWVSIASFMVAFGLLTRLKHERVQETEIVPHQTSKEKHIGGSSFVASFFHNDLVFYLAIWSLLAYSIIFFVDFTFLSEIKVNYQSSHDLATFIAIFFALGRLLAIAFKLLFSSRVMSRIGLANSLLIAPVLLLLINSFILLANEAIGVHLYLFGVMVLLFEVLRSTIQEPVFFVLFQPLDPHSRLKGHLIAKGYTLPFALLGVGGFLTVYQEYYDHIAIPFVSGILFFLLLVWACSVLFIKRAYLRTLIMALKKGYFSGSELFLNDKDVINLLVHKAKGHKPKEVIHALDLLERSGYEKLEELLIQQLSYKILEVQEYVVSRFMDNNMTRAVPALKEQLQANPDASRKPLFLKALFFLERKNVETLAIALRQLSPDCRKAAMVGLLYKSYEGGVGRVVLEELQKMVQGNADEKLAALDVISETRLQGAGQDLEHLLQDRNLLVCQKAIAVSGKVKAYSLLNLMLELAEEKGAFGSLQRALLAFGDGLYKQQHLQERLRSDTLLTLFIKVAARTKGEHSTSFLERVFKNYPAKADLVVDALWVKKGSISGHMQEHLSLWLKKKLSQSQVKAAYYLQLLGSDAVRLLQDALCSELQQDIRILLKGLALVYHREQIDSVIAVEKLGDTNKLSNALEMLELLLPKTYFKKLNALVELMQDIRCGQVVFPDRTRDTSSIISDILLENRGGCNAWTRSVACYMLPRLQDISFPLQKLDRAGEQEDVLFHETKNYVVSMLI